MELARLRGVQLAADHRETVRQGYRIGKVRRLIQRQGIPTGTSEVRPHRRRQAQLHGQLAAIGSHSEQSTLPPPVVGLIQVAHPTAKQLASQRQANAAQLEFRFRH